MMIYPCMLIFFHLFMWTKISQYRNVIQKYKDQFLLSFLMMLSINLLFFLYFSMEDTIYFWDYAGFWTKTMDYLSILDLQGTRAAISTLYQSMLYSEHSYLLCLFLTLPMKLFGKSFFVYTLSVLNLFVIPFMLNMLILMTALFEKYQMKIRVGKIGIVLVLFFPIYAVLLKGYADAAGLLFIVFLLIIEFLAYDDSWIFNALCTVNCFILIFLRRWYLFWVVAYFASKIIVSLFSKDIHVIKKTILRVLNIGVPLFLIFLLFFRPYLVALFNNDLATAYSAYKIDGFMNELIHNIHFYGLIIWVIALLGAIKGFVMMKRESLFMISILVITVFLFTRIQSMDEHHFHLLNTSVLFFVAIALHWDFKLSSLLIPLLVINLLHCLSFWNESKIHQIGNILFSHVSKVPEVLQEKQELISLAETIDQLCENGSYAYFSSSSLKFNADVLRNALLPEKRNAVPNLVNTSDVDLRDGFPRAFESIDYLITADPVQYHMMNPKDQSINALINNAVQNIDVVSKHYQLIESRWIGEVNIKIYKKSSNLDKDAKQYFVSEVLELYPGREDLLHGINE